MNHLTIALYANLKLPSEDHLIKLSAFSINAICNGAFMISPCETYVINDIKKFLFLFAYSVEVTKGSKGNNFLMFR